MPNNGRWKTLIISETIIALLLFAVLVSILIFAFTDDVFGVGWFSIGIAAAAVLAEIVRRFRHLRTDLKRE